MKKSFLLLGFYLVAIVSIVSAFSQDGNGVKENWKIKIGNISFSDKEVSIEVEYQNISSTDKTLSLPIKKPGFTIKLEELEDTFPILSVHITKVNKQISVYTYTELNSDNKIDKVKKENVKAGQSVTKKYNLKDFISWGACNPTGRSFCDDITEGITCTVDIIAAIHMETNKDTGPAILIARSQKWTTEVSMRDWQYIKYLEIMKENSSTETAPDDKVK